MMKYLVIGSVTLLMAWGCTAVHTKLSADSMEAWQQIKENYDNGHYITASEQLKVFTLANSSFARIDSAHFLLAKAHENLKEYILAANAYERLIRDYPNSELADKAQFGIAESYFRQSPHYGLAQENTETAITEYQILLEEFPTSLEVPKAEERIYELRSKMAHKDFDAGRLYHRQKSYRAALKYYDYILTTFYDTDWAVDALYYAAECHYKREELEMAQEYFAAFVQRYEGHDKVDLARRYLEEIRKELKQRPAANAAPEPEN